MIFTVVFGYLALFMIPILYYISTGHYYSVEVAGMDVRIHLTYDDMDASVKAIVASLKPVPPPKKDDEKNDGSTIHNYANINIVSK